MIQTRESSSRRILSPESRPSLLPGALDWPISAYAATNADGRRWDGCCIPPAQWNESGAASRLGLPWDHCDHFDTEKYSRGMLHY
jgi:hypothetical protein